MNPSYFVCAQRNSTKVRIPVYAVPELVDPATAARYGRKAKTPKESAFTMKSNFIRDGWYNVKVIDGETFRAVNA